jgi:hypothetical protein
MSTKFCYLVATINDFPLMSATVYHLLSLKHSEAPD